MTPPQAAQPAISMSPTAPEVHAASKFAVSVTSTDFNIAVGRTRHVFQSNGEAVGAGIEYTHAFSLSPEAVKQLAQILAVTINKYEQAYGAIPQDPEVLKKLAEMSKGPLKTAATKAGSTRRSSTKSK